MYIYPCNIFRVHYYNKIIYIFTNDGLVKKLDSEQTLFMNYLIRVSCDYNKIVENISTKLNITDKRNALNKVSHIINSLEGCMEVSFSKKEYKTPIITGVPGKCYPDDIQISLTNRCLHHCKHCFMNASLQGNDINLRYLEKLLQYVQGYTGSIEFTGGEPFLYKGLENVLEKFDKKFQFRVITSGNWGRIVSAETLKRFELIKLTLYGCSEEEHNKFVGVIDSFEHVMKNLHYIMKNNINLIVQTQAKDDKIESLRKFIDRCIYEGIENIMIGEIAQIGRAKKLNIFSSYNTDLIEKNIQDLKNEYKGKINLIFDNEQSITKNQGIGFFNCDAGKIKWHVSEDGIISPCAIFNKNLFSMGNIYNMDYIRLIDSEDEFKNFEEKWFANYSEIINIYRSNGENFDEICHSVYKKNIESGGTSL